MSTCRGRAGRRRLRADRPQAVRVERPGVAVARRPRHRRRRSGRSADRARLRRARAAPGVTVVETWDTLGMRPTQSHDTILDGVFVPDDRIGRVVPGRRRHRPVPRAMAVWALSLIAAVYLGIADRALELAVDRRQAQDVGRDRAGRVRLQPVRPAPDRRDVPRARRRRRHPRPVRRRLDRRRRPRRRWEPKIYSTKWRAVEAAKRVVDIALDVAGGGGMFTGSELERLYRDVRCGGFHPGNDALTHEMVGKAVLGDPRRQPALVTAVDGHRGSERRAGRARRRRRRRARRPRRRRPRRPRRRGAARSRLAELVERAPRPRRRSGALRGRADRALEDGGFAVPPEPLEQPGDRAQHRPLGRPHAGPAPVADQAAVVGGGGRAGRRCGRRSTPSRRRPRR